MTTTQPAALPEHTIGKHDHPEPHTMCWSDLELGAIKRYAESYALAALQPQPAAVVSDERQLLREIVENHAESLQALGDELRQRGVTQISYYGPQAEVVAKAVQLIDRARAILALRPQAVPMTEPVQRLSRYAGQTMRTARNPNITAREAIEIGDYLAAIGITAQGAQGEQG